VTDARVTFTGVTPYLYYEDAGAMLDWLSRVFGFEERSRFVDKDGIVQQAEMIIGDNELWFSGHGPSYWEQKGHGPEQLTLVWVDDVDAHYQQVRAAGVEADAPEDQTYDVRSYNVTDPEGYQWGFMSRLGTGYIQTIPTEEGGLQELRAGATNSGGAP
jgi:uncharacterized glyoxalase superfamily protein PhnB